MASQPTVINAIEATITSAGIDSGEIFIKKVLTSALNAVTGQYTQRFKTLGGGFDTPLPNSIGGAGSNGGEQIFIRNVDTNAFVIVKWNNGVGIVQVITLQPGGFIILWQPKQGVIAGTIPSVITVQSNVGGTFVEVFQGVIFE